MEAEGRDEVKNVSNNVPWKRLGITEAEFRANHDVGWWSSTTWTGALVTRDENFTGGIGKVISEPGEDGVAWVYWGRNDHQRYESREVVGELVRLDLDGKFMKGYKR